MESRIDGREPTAMRKSGGGATPPQSRALHGQRIAEVGARIRRSKQFCLKAVGEAVRGLKYAELDCERLTRHRKET